MPLELCPLPNLEADLWDVLSQVPRGAVTTYRSLATALGDKAAARWVGERMVRHGHTEDCACHRVVRIDGSIGRYVTGDSGEKRSRLVAEGIPFEGDCVDWQQRPPFEPPQKPVLQVLQQWQEQVRRATVDAPLAPKPRTVAAVDAAFTRSGQIVAAYVRCDASSGEPLDESTRIEAVSFPYIPGYLAFRELPAIVALCRELIAAGRMADVLLVDGNGRLHPRRAGIATCLGTVLEMPTIGIGKSLLCGKIMETQQGRSAMVVENEEPIAVRLPSPQGGKPIYVSPGHHSDLPSAADLVQRLQLGNRLPKPIQQADRLSKQVARRMV